MADNSTLSVSAGRDAISATSVTVNVSEARNVVTAEKVVNISSTSRNNINKPFPVNGHWRDTELDEDTGKNLK